MSYCTTMYMQHWTKLEISGTKPSPRSLHATCCIAGPLTGQHHPILLIVGGYERNKSLCDAWLLDVDRGVWSEVSVLCIACWLLPLHMLNSRIWNWYILKLHCIRDTQHNVSTCNWYFAATDVPSILLYFCRSLCLKPSQYEGATLLICLVVDQTSELWSCLEVASLTVLETNYQRPHFCCWVSVQCLPGPLNCSHIHHIHWIVESRAALYMHGRQYQ